VCLVLQHWLRKNFAMKKIISLSIIMSLLFSVFAQKKNDSLYKEKYRPQFHFTPAINWTNDPNGLVYYKGEYHLFYQHNPFGNVWGHMSWGHAISKDLVHWKQLPIAIREENGVMIFSGSCVIDEKNTSGFAKNSSQTPMVAIYTGHYIPDSSKKDNYFQAQYIAYSLDDGITWKKYENNPVLDLHKKDFRDPCVFWYEPEKKWVMALVLPKEHIVQFYSSLNLKEWNHMSDFGPAGDTSDIWECPSLTKVPEENNPTKIKWVLFNSVQSTMQYFVGGFDGTKFTNENPSEKIYRPDYGTDYYAAIVYTHLSIYHKPVLLGWANNWKYANDIPVSPWKSAMALPRTLSLKQNNNEWILNQQPISALTLLRKELWEEKNISVNEKKLLPLKSQQAEIELSWKPSKQSVSGIDLAVGKTNFIAIGYDEGKQKIFIDRFKAGDTSFNKNFASLSYSENLLKTKNGKIYLHVFFDNSIVEVFANDGTCVMTTQIFPEKNNNSIELFSNSVVNYFDDVKIWQLKSAW